MYVSVLDLGHWRHFDLASRDPYTDFYLQLYSCSRTVAVYRVYKSRHRSRLVSTQRNTRYVYGQI
jgi:hypothetical protein